jgi:hypothetical protein
MGTGVDGTYLGVGLKEVDPIGWGEGLWAAHWVESCSSDEFAVQDCSQLFPPLAEDSLHESCERFPWVEGPCALAWADRKHRARDFGRRPEATRGENRDLFYICQESHHHADRSIGFTASLCHQSVTHLALDSDELTAAFWVALKQRCNQWRGGLVREVGNERERSTRERAENLR